MSEWLVFFLLLQEQETLSFIRENLEKSDQLTKNMVGRSKHTQGQLRLTLIILIIKGGGLISIRQYFDPLLKIIIILVLGLKYLLIVSIDLVSRWKQPVVSFFSFHPTSAGTHYLRRYIKAAFIAQLVFHLYFFPKRSPSCLHSRAAWCSWRTPSSRFTSRRKTCNGCRRTWTKLCPAWITSSATTMWPKTRTGSSERGGDDLRMQMFCGYTNSDMYTNFLFCLRPTGRLDEYLACIARIQKAVEYFQDNNPDSPELNTVVKYLPLWNYSCGKNFTIHSS